MAAVGAGQEAGKTQKKKKKKKEAERSNDEFSQLKMSSVKLKKHPVTACISNEAI